MNIMFISGGWDPRGKVMGECYVLNIVTNVIIRKEIWGSAVLLMSLENWSKYIRLWRIQ